VRAQFSERKECSEEERKILGGRKMPTVPVDGRKQHEKWIVEVVNALHGREPTAGVQQQVVGDRYILDKYPPPSRVSGYGSGTARPEPEPAAAPKSSAAATALWPNLR
jgi:hypothetical protein